MGFGFSHFHLSVTKPDAEEQKVAVGSLACFFLSDFLACHCSCANSTDIGSGGSHHSGVVEVLWVSKTCSCLVAKTTKLS
jgi:hypothetical protein